MKKNTFSIFAILALVVFIVSSCVKGDEIGDLYGRWKLDNFSCTGKSVDVSNVFMGFTGDVYSFQANKGYDWGMFTKTDTELYLNKMQYTTSFYEMFMPKQMDAKFTIKQLNSKSLVLQRNDSIWTFSKLLGK